MNIKQTIINNIPSIERTLYSVLRSNFNIVEGTNIAIRIPINITNDGILSNISTLITPLNFTALLC